jgi:hypothetical protein
MDQKRAERRASVLNSLSRHPSISYIAAPLESTRWESHRFGVIQRFNGNPVGVALS